MAKEFGLSVHLDGARFANALVALGCTAAEMTWKAGIDAVSFGGTKNGLMGVEAVVIFDPAKGHELELRRKRGAHLLSKHRFLSAQMLAYLEDGLWLDMAGNSNAMGQRLAKGLVVAGGTLVGNADANLMFAQWTRAAHTRLHNAKAQYYLADGVSLEGGQPSDQLVARLVANWASTTEDVDQFLSILAG